ncbi:formate--tetrahydrofolate ligase [Lactobacillus sp. DCY120]|uniref:Formate--tetrahydrofolate ligase n=1 Tax=Bombilactobacillus apium TaxID=2675299 RepID=A0A850QYK9_9LACO|nr:formate--tetrahydrofolate ligase [Bombilactobacillus apium]NVY95809.1 formate--tetrahydrofolate ligase [Bombilactobacillus apium]
MLSDIEIAQTNAQQEMWPITQVAAKLGLTAEELELYGSAKAKITSEAQVRAQKQAPGKLILVTAMNPTPAGEGKSTVMLGLGDALQRLHQKTAVALREPSLGPVMGRKGGAAGGGYAQVVPMEDLNLHFTGDMHALTTAINTLAALIDNHLQQGNQLRLDPRRIIWQRALDVNDRGLRNIVLGLGGPKSGVVREEHFQITVASELMAVLCLTEDQQDLKRRIQKMLIGYNVDNEPVFVHDLHAEGALTLILKDAIKPNLVQTLEHTPVFVHGGPFANIAHGCNSIIATNLAVRLSDYTLTEAGFGADLGAEKFLDLVSQHLVTSPTAIVLVATLRALRYNGGQPLAQNKTSDLAALRRGFVNLKRHLTNLQAYQRPVIVALNQFADDNPAEVELLQQLCQELGIAVHPVTVFRDGGAGAQSLAQSLIDLPVTTGTIKPIYEAKTDVVNKIECLAQKIYHARKVNFSPTAQKQIQELRQQGWDQLPICVAKTPYSFSDNPHLLGAPTDFELQVTAVVPKLGAGFLVVLTGNVLTMPGLPAHPAALDMDIAADGEITGLF